MTNAETLKAAGMDIDALPPQQQEALSKLDQSEVDALVAIREKLNEGEEVTGHSLENPTEKFEYRSGPDGAPMPRLADGGFVW